MEAPVDFFGNEISVGDLIVYPTATGHQTVMNSGTVAEIVTGRPCGRRVKRVTKLKVNKERDSGANRACVRHAITIEKLDRVVIYRKGGV